MEDGISTIIFFFFFERTTIIYLLGIYEEFTNYVLESRSSMYQSHTIYLLEDAC